MSNDLSASGRGIKRIEQQVRDDLDNFTSEGQDGPVRLNALMNNNPLPLCLGAIKRRTPDSSSCSFIAIAR
jgi:hypothetical protein